MNKPNIYYIDLFCGAGGVTSGVVRAGGKVILCINHDPLAILSHYLNHKNILHYTEDIRHFNVAIIARLVRKIRERDPNAIICLWASLECIHFSKAKGGQERDADSRTLAEHLFKYIFAANPDYIDIENVVEFMSWGPLRIACAKMHKDRCDLKMASNKQAEKQVHPYYMIPVSRKKGIYYSKWVNEIKHAGYDYDYRILNAADFGARTSRIRYFGQFKRPELPFTWPEPTHAKNPEKSNGGIGKKLMKWKPVKPALDLDDKGRSIFGRKKDLSPNTYTRIYNGLIKHVAGGHEPEVINNKIVLDKLGLTYPTWDKTGAIVNNQGFITKWFSVNNTNKSFSDPSVTITTMNHLGVVQPVWMNKYRSNPTGKVSNPIDVNGPAPTLATGFGLTVVQPEFLTKYYSGDPMNKNQGINQPLGTILTKDTFSLIQPEYLVDFYTKGGSRDPDAPLGSILTKDKFGICFLSKYFSEYAHNQGIDIPSGTITTIDHHSLIQTEGFISKYYSSNGSGSSNTSSFHDPIGTVMARDGMAIAFLSKYYGTGVTHGILQPADTLTTKDRMALVWLDKQFKGPTNHQGIFQPAGSILTNDKHCKVSALLVNNFSGGGQHGSIYSPSGTILTVPKSNLVSLEPWLLNHTYDNTGTLIDSPAPTILASRRHYYLLNPQWTSKGVSIEKPCFTLIARMDKMPPCLVEAESGQPVITIYDDDLEIVKKIKMFMALYGIMDIKMRMLKVPELLRIQGFGDKYILKGNQTDQKKFIGNSVPPRLVMMKTKARHEILAKYFENKQLVAA